MLLALGVLVGCTGDGPSAERRLTIAFSNDMQGEVRSCGCASNDFGGLGRRATFLESVRDSTSNLLLVEGGGFFGTNLNYGREKADLTLKSMQLMGYDGVVIGEEELGFGVEYIVRRTREIGLPVIVANLWDATADTLFFPAQRQVTLRSGLRVGIIGVMGDGLRLPPQVSGGKVRLSSAIEAVRRHARGLRETVDIVVVLAHMSGRDARRLAQKIDEIDVIVHGSESRVMRRVRPFNNASVLQVSSQGRYMGVAHAVLGTDGRIRSLVTQITPLSKLYPDDVAITKLFSAYDLDIAAKEKTDLPAAVFAARRGLEDPFSGAAACQKCHADIDAQWKGTAHAHAFDVLTAQSRGYDLDCTPCHTTGFYERGGFERLAVTPDLANVQCESCHGNGSDHVADPKQKTPGDAPAACRNCHTVQQTPDFEFGAFWARIRH